MPKRILLADDSITIQKVVELTFSDGDYEIVSANNGVRALQKLAESMPDIILSDIIMPEKNGYEVCEFVKSHPEYRDIPVILLTGTFEPFDPDRAEKAGCDAVVTKPFESQSLINKVEELIQKRRSRDEESRAVRGDNFVSQPLDTFVASPAVEQETPSAQTAELDPTMAWQLPTVVDESSEPEEQLDTDSPFSAEDSAPAVMDPQEDSPFGSDSGWQPIVSPEPDSQEMSGEPFDASPTPEDETRSEGFHGESIFSPEDAGAGQLDEISDSADVSNTSEPPPMEDAPLESAGDGQEEVRDDLSTRAWAVPVDGAWAVADVNPEPEGAETENTVSFPATAGDAGHDSSEAEATDQDDAPPLYQPSVTEETQDSTPWNDYSGSEPPSEQAQDEQSIAEEVPPPHDVWAIEPAENYDAPADPAALELTSAEPEQKPQSAPAWGSPDDDMSPPRDEAAAEHDVPATAEPGRTLTDEDVERIARRVVELMSGDTVKNIAWEVVPDIAEMVVRERVRQLEEE